MSSPHSVQREGKSSATQPLRHHAWSPVAAAVSAAHGLPRERVPIALPQGRIRRRSSPRPHPAVHRATASNRQRSCQADLSVFSSLWRIRHHPPGITHAKSRPRQPVPGSGVPRHRPWLEVGVDLRYQLRRTQVLRCGNRTRQQGVQMIGDPKRVDAARGRRQVIGSHQRGRRMTSIEGIADEADS